VYFLAPNVTSSELSSNSTIASSTEANFVSSPVACTVSALNVGVNNYFDAGEDTTTIQVYHNLDATLMTCSVNNSGALGGVGCSDLDHTFTVVQGDSLSIAFHETSLSPFNHITVGLVCQ